MRMKISNVVFVLMVLVLFAVGAGFYRGWFVLSSQPAGSDSKKVHIDLIVDPDRVKGDAESVEQKAAELADRAVGRAKDTGRNAAGSVKTDAE